MSHWTDGPLLSIDFETTGTDPTTCRPVSVALVGANAASRTSSHSHWVVDCGVPVPDDAAAIHGYTTERVQSEGVDPATVITEIIERVAKHVGDGYPLVAYNAAYDLTVLAAEAERHDLAFDVPRPVVDPFILDKHIDRYRRGKRTLTACADHYNVSLDGAHDAAFDALCAARLAWRVGQIPPIADMSLDDLHDAQVEWAAEQAASLAQYFESKGKDASDVDGSWPVRKI